MPDSSREGFLQQDFSTSHDDSPKPESRLMSDQLSPVVRSLAMNLSKQILAICRNHGIESTLDASIESNLSQAVSDSVGKFIEHLEKDPSLMPDAKHLLDLQYLLTSAHEENNIPIDSVFVSTTREEASRGGVLYHKNNLDLRDVTSTKGLLLPRIIEGSLDLNSLVSAEGLVFPETIGGSLDLNSLTSPEGLVLPKEIGISLYLNKITSAEGIVFPETIGDSLGLNGLTSARGLILPKIIRGGLGLKSLTSAEGLILPEVIGEIIALSSLVSIEGLALPETFKGRLLLDTVPEAEKDILRIKYPHVLI